MADNRVVTISSGINQLTSDSFIGRTVEEILDDLEISEYLSLEGNEQAQVSSNDSAFDDVTGSYRLTGGDTLRFARNSGGKG